MKIHRLPRQAGLTIVELMIAITLALLITVAVGLIFLSNQRTYRATDVIARQQESLRFATETIAYDLRMTGHFGCSFATSPANNTLVDRVSSSDPNVKYTAPIQGWTGGSVPDGLTTTELFQSITGSPQDHSKSDVFRVQYASAQHWPLDTAMATASDDIDIGGGADSFVGNILLLADCDRGELFVASHTATDTVIKHAGANNTSASFTKAFDTAAEVMRFVNRIYYIGTSNGRPTLMRKSLKTAPLSGGGILETEEIADGIAEMQILYGEDTDGDEKVNIYRTASTVANWANVLSARVCLLYESSESDVGERTGTNQFQKYTSCAGTEVTASDRRYRQSIMFTATLRNRVP